MANVSDKKDAGRRIQDFIDADKKKIREDVERMISDVCCGVSIDDFNEFYYDADPQELADKLVEYICGL